MTHQGPAFRHHGFHVTPARLLALLLPLCFCSVHGEPVYRWVDADGRVHFGDKPPPQGAEVIVMPVTPGIDADLDARRRRGMLLGEILGEDRAARERERRDDRQARLDRRMQCDQARQRLERMTRATYIYEDSGDPANPHILDEAERTTVEQSLQEQVRRHCGGAAPGF